MLGSLYSAVNGLKTHQQKMDVVGNNISNVSTYGYKASRMTGRLTHNKMNEQKCLLIVQRPH